MTTIAELILRIDTGIEDARKKINVKGTTSPSVAVELQNTRFSLETLRMSLSYLNVLDKTLGDNE